MVEVGKCPDIPRIVLGDNGVIVAKKVIYENSYAKDGNVPRNSQPPKIFECKDGVCEDQFGIKKPAEEVLPKAFFAKPPEEKGFFAKLFGSKPEDNSSEIVSAGVNKTLTPCVQELVGDQGVVESTVSLRNADKKGWHFSMVRTGVPSDPNDPIIKVTDEIYPNNKTETK